MPPTGYKGISTKLDRRGYPEAFKVYVAWKGKSLETTVRFIGGRGRRMKTKEEALAIAVQKRDEFEEKLGKPRTEYGIRSDADGIRIDRERKRIQVSLGGGKSKTISYRRLGFRNALGLAKEIRSRRLGTS